MLRTTAIVLCFCCVAETAVAQPASHAATSPAADAQLLTLYRQMMDGIVRGDSAALARLWAPGYVYTYNTPDTIVTLTRAERLHTLAQERRNAATKSDSSASTTDSARVERCAFKTYGTFAAGPCHTMLYSHQGSQRETRPALATVLFTREGGTWRILASHTSYLTEPK